MMLDPKAAAAKDRHLRTTFNSSLEKFNATLAEQGDCCAICGKPFVAGAAPNAGFKKEVYTAFLDHDHRCCPRWLKKFCGKCCRGLLCFTCNKFLVGVLERQNIPIDKLTAYVKKWNHIQPSGLPSAKPRTKYQIAQAGLIDPFARLAKRKRKKK